MRKTIKISKHEMKEDKFTTFILRAKEYVTEQWVYVAGGVAIIVAAVVLISFLRSSGLKNEQKANEVYSRGISELFSRNYQLAVVDFKSIIDQYGSSNPARMALFNMGNAYLGLKNFSDAKTAFEQYVSKYPDDKYFATSAIAGVAACLAGTGDNAGAADKYREAAEKFAQFALAGEYYYQALFYYVKSGNTESAKVILGKITKEFPGSRYAVESSRFASENNIVL